MPPDTDMTRLFHLCEAAVEAVGHTANRNHSDWETDRLLQLSLIRLLEVVGEAAASISVEFQKEHPEIPWRTMIGMRNRLIHGYFDVNLDVVWQTVQEDLPGLISVVRPILVNAGLEAKGGA